ncbi:hypothetical protein SPBR_08028 [Sporothrix brasiliensis 5110]|uniref:Uncharacterized protein n=1 Tax=Sporothrix brasiliensis 5110 TaxID=1398154 RepID=A0A0C2FEH8_9PEZI|nr:uncharacterized protein SPBR_08028 [Sporothrix brasiliensis 5110]KIH89543.1 hypothetical protein SPBR_08028 [Sporothrix brasiliensis 5110]
MRRWTLCIGHAKPDWKEKETGTSTFNTATVDVDTGYGYGVRGCALTQEREDAAYRKERAGADADGGTPPASLIDV